MATRTSVVTRGGGDRFGDPLDPRGAARLHVVDGEDDAAAVVGDGDGEVVQCGPSSGFGGANLKAGGMIDGGGRRRYGSDARSMADVNSP